MKVLITGGSGFLGSYLTHKILRQFPSYTITILSRNEYRQALLRSSLEEYDRKRVKLVIGNVRNPLDVNYAMRGVDIVIHAAALKRIDSVEENILTAVQTNIYGTENLLRAAEMQNVMRFCLISTDKASRPHTAYGASKYMCEQMVRHFNVSFDRSVMRYGKTLRKKKKTSESVTLK